MAKTTIGEELLYAWKRGAKCQQILNMREEEMVDFALRNEMDVREVRTENSLVGWRLYETHLDLDGKTRVPDELYYVVRKV